MIAAALLLTACWAYFGEIQDVIMIYLLIMPLGIAQRWQTSPLLRIDESSEKELA